MHRSRHLQRAAQTTQHMICWRTHCSTPSNQAYNITSTTSHY